MKHELPEEVVRSINTLSNFCKEHDCVCCPFCAIEQKCIFRAYAPYRIGVREVREPKFIVEVKD